MSPPQPPDFVERRASLQRLSTVRTGGPADWFARVGGEAQLLEALAWARAAGEPVAVLGSGSNLLIADEGVSGLVLKLDRELARIERDGSELVCGGGARLPAVAAESARSGLAGIEFGVNIPGTVGGSVRMNANAYGGQLASVLSCVRVVTAEGARERSPAALGFAYRASNLREGEVVAAARFALMPADPAVVRASLAELRRRRHESQPQAIKTFGSTFKNPSGAASGGDAAVGAEQTAGGEQTSGAEQTGSGATPQTAGMLLSEAGCNGLQIGAARFSVKHANFVENLGGASTSEIVRLMDEGRRRVHERFGIWLEPEVQTLGPVRFPWRS
ncbi:MAG: UDP-N-acetylmuramate dehydrogenase [Solirubrobacteraceae bacterium]